MKRFLPVLLLALAACSPSSPVATQPSSPTPQASTASATPAASPTIAASPAVATPKPKSEEFYSGTAYLKGLGIDDNGAYESHINFEGSATLNANDKLYLNLSAPCGESSSSHPTSKIIIQLNPKAKTWKQLSEESEDCDGYKSISHEYNTDEQHQPYTTEDLGTKVKFNLGTNDPKETYHFRDLYGATINKQSEDRD